MKRQTALLASTVAVSPALATDLPMPDLPDPTPLCQSLGKGAADRAGADAGKVTTSECLRKSQDGYDTAKWLWPKLSDYSAKHCAYVAGLVTHDASTSGWGYVTLGNCASQMYFEYDVPRQEQPPFHKD